MVAASRVIDPDLIRALERDNQDFCRAMSARDVDAAMACVGDSPDLINVLWGSVLRGSESFRGALIQMFEQHPSVHLQINECSFVPAGDGVIAVGTATYVLRDRAGVEKRIVERWTDLRRVIDCKWRVVLNHATVVPE